jgi:hypothetical protein
LENGEPDVLIAIKAPDDTYSLILIEAKYLSAKSGGALSFEELEIAQAPRDQLAREYTDLLQAHRVFGIPSGQIVHRALVYLTAERSIPEQTLLESLREIEHFHYLDEPPALYWTNWHALHPILNKTVQQKPWEKPLLDDLRWLLERKGLVIFHGFTAPAQVRKLEPGSVYLRPRVPFAARYNFDLQPLSPLHPKSVYTSMLRPRAYQWRVPMDRSIHNFYKRKPR